jgi:polyphenol oxidase
MDKSILTYKSSELFPQFRTFTTLRHTIAGEVKPRFTGNPDQFAEENRLKLANILNLDIRQLVFPRQTHTRSVVRLSGIPTNALNDTDAIITDKAGICLCVQTADCVPLLIYDPVMNVIAAVHAGWRGTVGLIAKEVVQQFNSHFSSSSQNIRVIIGPSIGPDKYEVGNEVVDAVMKSIPNPAQCLIKRPSGKYHFNLWEANRQILLECGILKENIDISGRCTFTEKEFLFSARREGIETGRIVSGIMLLEG